MVVERGSKLKGSNPKLPLVVMIHGLSRRGNIGLRARLPSNLSNENHGSVNGFVCLTSVERLGGYHVFAANAKKDVAQGNS